MTIDNFIRAETDSYFRTMEFGKLRHSRTMASIDAQDVVRMNRDTLYSSGVFDLDAAPVTVELPDPASRFMSMQVISQDHYTTEVSYAPGTYTYSRDKVGTRYVFLIIRTLANPEDPADLAQANALQDAIVVNQARSGSLELPDWDPVSQATVRDTLNALAPLRGDGEGAMFGGRDEVDPLAHLIGTAIGWGGNPDYAAVYDSFFPAKNDGRTTYSLTVKDVPVDGFWSVSLYNDKGFFEKNDRNAYSLSSLTAIPDSNGSYTIQFGDCQDSTRNCLPVMAGWNYTVRLYRPRREILDGSWTFPTANPTMD